MEMIVAKASFITHRFCRMVPAHSNKHGSVCFMIIINWKVLPA